MASGQGGGVIGEVDRLYRLGTAAAMTEGQLLGRFAADRDEASFTALVAIHGPMVLGVCRRVLSGSDDADDAFQATFLVLARKAGSIRRPDLLGPWLHGVARRVSVRIRSQAARRRAVERPGAEFAAMTRDDNNDRHELGAVLDEEIGRLPERLRRPLVLCDLEGRTREEAARDLRWTTGTVRSRLAKAREILRSRLTRRGLAPSGGCLVALSPLDAPPAAVPPSLATATVRAALSFAARSTSAATVSASAASIAEGVLRSMIVTPMKVAATALLTAGLVALPYLFASEPRAAPPTTRAQAPAVPASVSPAEEVMARMVKTYADARSYRDEGEVTLVFVDASGRQTQKKPFATMFVRPKLYRFEFTERGTFEEPKRYVIWSDAAPDRAKTWWTIQPKVREDSLARAAGAAAGVSSLSSLTIPRLLMPQTIQGQSPADLKGFLGLVDIENVDGVPCDKVEGTNLRGDVDTVWIDKASSLVRKVSGTSKILKASVEQTTVYRPQVDVEIAAKEFAFEPPKP